MYAETPLLTSCQPVFHADEVRICLLNYPLDAKKYAVHTVCSDLRTKASVTICHVIAAVIGRLLVHWSNWAHIFINMITLTLPPPHVLQVMFLFLLVCLSVCLFDHLHYFFRLIQIQDSDYDPDRAVVVHSLLMPLNMLNILKG